MARLRRAGEGAPPRTEPPDASRTSPAAGPDEHDLHGCASAGRPVGSQGRPARERISVRAFSPTNPSRPSSPTVPLQTSRAKLARERVGEGRRVSDDADLGEPDAARSRETAQRHPTRRCPGGRSALRCFRPGHGSTAPARPSARSRRPPHRCARRGEWRRARRPSDAPRRSGRRERGMRSGRTGRRGRPGTRVSSLPPRRRRSPPASRTSRSPSVAP